MDTVKQQLTYNDFLERLEYFKRTRFIKIMKRGLTKKFAFKRVNLDPNSNSFDQFAEKLFFYGEKSKYFWEQKIGRQFSINDIGESTFEYIFTKFKEISENKDANQGTSNYRIKNSKTFEYFNDVKNLSLFVNATNNLVIEEKKRFRNYYFRIIHQLGETDYKKASLNISGSEEEEITKQFSNNEITINFWDLNFNQFQSQTKFMPMFKGKTIQKPK